MLGTIYQYIYQILVILRIVTKNLRDRCLLTVTQCWASDHSSLVASSNWAVECELGWRCEWGERQQQSGVKQPTHRLPGFQLPLPSCHRKKQRRLFFWNSKLRKWAGSRHHAKNARVTVKYETRFTFIKHNQCKRSVVWMKNKVWNGPPKYPVNKTNLCN